MFKSGGCGAAPRCGFVGWPAADDGVAELKGNPNPLLTLLGGKTRHLAGSSRNTMLEVFTNVKSAQPPSLYGVHAIYTTTWGACWLGIGCTNTRSIITCKTCLQNGCLPFVQANVCTQRQPFRANTIGRVAVSGFKPAPYMPGRVCVYPSPSVISDRLRTWKVENWRRTLLFVRCPWTGEGLGCRL
jgi:hypothetical protein